MISLEGVAQDWINTALCCASDLETKSLDCLMPVMIINDTVFGALVLYSAVNDSSVSISLGCAVAF